MSLASLSIRRPVLVTSAFLVILALGGLARTRLSTALYPDVVFPIINVVVPFPGGGSDEIEAQISRPLENALGSLPGIRLVRSVSLDGASVMTSVFTMDTDLRFAEQKVQQTVSRVRAELPSGILEPQVRTVDPSDTPVATLSLSIGEAIGGPRGGGRETTAQAEARLSEIADREVRPRLEQVTDVGQVELVGARRREIQAELDLGRLRAREMTASEVVGRLGAAGLNIPAGQLENLSDPTREVLVRTVGQFDSLDALRKTPIRFVGNEIVTTLGDVATVEDGLEDERNRVYVDGQRGLVFRIYRRSGGNTVEVSDAIRTRVAELNQDLAPRIPGFRLSMLRDGARPVREAIQDATDAILLGVVLTIGVVLLFLGSIRSTVITGLALPNSLLGAFLLMWIAGFSVNITTLAALALGVGLLIDDAIVVRENIFRRIESGEAPRVAAVAGTDEVSLAVVATTLTVLSVFGPVSFMSGLIGQFFKEFGLTICFAMLISLFDSLTVAPMLSAYLAVGKAGVGTFGRFMERALSPFHRLQDFQERQYLVLLRQVMRRPSAVLLLAFVIFGLSFVVLDRIPKSFVPGQETGEFQVVMALPADVSLVATDRMARKIEAEIRAMPEVARSLTVVGGSYGEQNQASIVVILKPPAERRRSSAGVKEEVRKALRAFPDSGGRVEDLMDIGGGAGQPYSVLITGEDALALKRVSGELVARLKASRNLKDLDRSYRAGAQEQRWVIEPDRAKALGVSSAEAGQELRLLVAGATPTRLHDSGQAYPVRVRLRPDQRDLRVTYPRILVPNLNHNLIPLTLVARKEMAETPAHIERQDRKRYIAVGADLSPTGGGLSAALAETRHLFDSGEIKLPPGVNFELAGQTRDFEELLGSAILAVALSAIAMYVVLAALYESFFVPLAIMLVLPLAVCGAFYALGLTGSTLDIYSIVGCVLLMGVAAKNSILLVDHIQEAMREGKALDEAVLRAGQVRIRPILMTSFALIAGMAPMALALQESARSRAPMAIAVIGGVVSSTLLTLVVVPAAYGYILRAEAWVLRKLRGVFATGG